MTDKQRADHVQAKYWNGFLTRTEAQKVFDDSAQVIKAQGMVLQKMDAVVTYIAEKLDIKPADINAWIEKKIADASTTGEEAQDGQDTVRSVLLDASGRAASVAVEGA